MMRKHKEEFTIKTNNGAYTVRLLPLSGKTELRFRDWTTVFYRDGEKEVLFTMIGSLSRRDCLIVLEAFEKGFKKGKESVYDKLKKFIWEM